MPPTCAKVLGPYANGKKWRLVIFNPDRQAMLIDSREEAEALKAGLLRTLTDQSRIPIETALEEYLTEKARDGVVASTLNTLRYKMRHFLPLETALCNLTQELAIKLYQEETQRTGRFGTVVRAATHRGLLRAVKSFFRWTVERKYLRENPFAAVKPVGKVNAGKPQLRLDEARRLNQVLLHHAEAGEEGALAVLIQIVMGLRSGEVLRLQVRDVDNGGASLWVEGTKTKNARRLLAVESEPLSRLLSRFCAGRKRDEWLFGPGRSRPHFTDYLWHRVQKYCALADVPIVCPHSLRGLHSTLAMQRGASSRFVADALGHSSDAITKRHYIDGTAMHNASIKRVATALATKPPVAGAEKTSPDLDGLATTLCSLGDEQLQTLLAAVAGRRKAADS
jgi:integrase